MASFNIYSLFNRLAIVMIFSDRFLLALYWCDRLLVSNSLSHSSFLSFPFLLNKRVPQPIRAARIDSVFDFQLGNSPKNATIRQYSIKNSDKKREEEREREWSKIMAYTFVCWRYRSAWEQRLLIFGMCISCLSPSLCFWFQSSVDEKKGMHALTCEYMLIWHCDLFIFTIHITIFYL